MIFEKIWPVKKYYQEILQLNYSLSEQTQEINDINSLVEKMKNELALNEKINNINDEHINQLNKDNENLKSQLSAKDSFILGLEGELEIQHAKSNAVNSIEYWEERYKMGGTSGDGSYNRLAEFKASIINKFVKKHSIKSVIELGCGDGNQLLYTEYPQYTGIDVSAYVIERDKEKFKEDESKRFFCTNNREEYIHQDYDLVLSLDVIFHLLEDSEYKSYMDDLFMLSSKYVIVYSSNHEAYTPWPEFRHRNFMRYVQCEKAKEWDLMEFIPNKFPYVIGQEHDTSSSDFYIFSKKSVN